MRRRQRVRFESSTLLTCSVDCASNVSASIPKLLDVVERLLAESNERLLAHTFQCGFLRYNVEAIIDQSLQASMLPAQHTEQPPPLPPFTIPPNRLVLYLLTLLHLALSPPSSLVLAWPSRISSRALVHTTTSSSFPPSSPCNSRLLAVRALCATRSEVCRSACCSRLFSV